MQQKLHESRARERLATSLHTPLQRHARATFRRRTLDPAFVHDASYLVPRDDADAFRAQVDAFGAAHPELALVCTGPWAPYTFAADGEGIA
jgi:hypothetical protein